MSWRFPAIASHRLPDWIGARCDLGDGCNDCAGRLYDDWRAYAKSRGIEPGSPAEFASHMERRGFVADRLVGERRRIRWGLRLRPIPGGESKVG